MLPRIARWFTRLFEQALPDAFVFAAGLTLVAFAAAILGAGQSPGAAIDAWRGGLWTLLPFMAQIAVTLVTGHALALTPPVARALDRVARLPRSATQAVAMVGFASGVASLLSWSLGLVAGAVLAREAARSCRARGIQVHYPLLVASAYSGFVIWHQGLSSSIGLLIATKGHFLEAAIGVVPVTETIFAPFNVAIALAVLFTLPLMIASLHPPPAETLEIPDTPAEVEAPEAGVGSIAARVERHPALSLAIAALGALALARHFRTAGLDLNVMNFVFLVLGLLLAGSPIAYVRRIERGGRALGPILLQYPFYGGLMGLVVESGLGRTIAGGFAALANADTLPVFTMWAGGIINVFVPSGGGQWAVQGPIATEAAVRLGASVPKVAMAVAMGDQWTNMIQPFWTIPALAIAGLHVREVMGYSVIALVHSGVIFSLGLLLA